MSSVRHIVLAGTDIFLTEIHPGDGETRRARELAAVARLLGAAVPGGDTIAHRPDGAPYLEGHTELYVSVSHSLQYAALSVSLHRHGIDIEALRPRLRDVSPRFINDKDIVDRSSLPALLHAWTAKEAVFKAASADHNGLMLWDICLESDSRATVPGEPTDSFTLVSQAIDDDNLLTLALSDDI